MDAVLRAALVYGMLLVLFRVAGRRTIAKMTSFDLVLAIVVGESVSQALNAGEPSLIQALVLATTLISIDVLLSVIKRRSPRAGAWLDGLPMVVVEDGKPLDALMRRARIDRDDVLAAARSTHGIESLDQIKYAVLEHAGGISIVPKRSSPQP